LTGLDIRRLGLLGATVQLRKIGTEDIPQPAATSSIKNWIGKKKTESEAALLSSRPFRFEA
jgi:hypothetical protein